MALGNVSDRCADRYDKDYHARYPHGIPAIPPAARGALLAAKWCPPRMAEHASTTAGTASTRLVRAGSTGSGVSSLPGSPKSPLPLSRQAVGLRSTASHRSDSGDWPQPRLAICGQGLVPCQS